MINEPTVDNVTWWLTGGKFHFLRRTGEVFLKQGALREVMTDELHLTRKKHVG